MFRDDITGNHYQFEWDRFLTKLRFLDINLILRSKCQTYEGWCCKHLQFKNLTRYNTWWILVVRPATIAQQLHNYCLGCSWEKSHCLIQQLRQGSMPCLFRWIPLGVIINPTPGSPRWHVADIWHPMLFLETVPHCNEIKKLPGFGVTADIRLSKGYVWIAVKRS